MQLGVVTAGGVVYHSWCWQRRRRFPRAFRLLTLWAPDLSPTLLPTVGEAVGVDARKQLAMTEDMLTLYTSEELEDVATELKLTQQMKGDKKGEKVASLLPLLKAGLMTKDVVKVIEGANP